MAATRMPARVAAIFFQRADLVGGVSPAGRGGVPSLFVEQGSIVLEDTSVEQEELWHDDGSTDDRDGWWCVRTDPFPCPASGCSYVADFMTAAHLILVWQTQDDPNLLKQAARARDVGRNPRIVGYRLDYGPSASYYAWIAAGRPVHGVRAQ
jgi:hypothetical protein